VKKILLSRTDRIGDLVLSKPAIATVRRSFPDAHIAMVCSSHNCVVMERNGDVDELVVMNDGEDPAAVGARHRGVSIAIALAPRSIDLRLVRATAAPTRIGYTYVRRYFARLAGRLCVNRMMISEADPGLSDRHPDRFVRHEVDQLLDLVALAGAAKRVERLRIDVRPEDRDAIAALPVRPIVLHLGLRWFQSGSTLSSTIALLALLRKCNAPLVVTYAPECERYVPEISQAGVADVVVGGLPFYRWAAVLERAALVVTVDTGATHVASAMRRPTVVAFEHRHFALNSQEWAPYGVPSVLLRKPADESERSLETFRGEVVAAVERLLHG
jgi:ADP-heptose:LPS heptosyltransferase